MRPCRSYADLPVADFPAGFAAFRPGTFNSGSSLVSPGPAARARTACLSLHYIGAARTRQSTARAGATGAAVGVAQRPVRPDADASVNDLAIQFADRAGAARLYAQQHRCLRSGRGETISLLVDLFVDGHPAFTYFATGPISVAGDAFTSRTLIVRDGAYYVQIGSAVTYSKSASDFRFPPSVGQVGLAEKLIARIQAARQAHHP
jgi:hypothetical protein